MISSCLRVVLLFLCMLVISCGKRRPDGFPENVDIEPFRRPSAQEIPYRLAQKVGQENVPRMIALGRMLFFDPRLSQTGLMSCATCHNPAFNWTDSLKVSIENRSKRTMALFNLAWDERFLWDGSMNSLAGQIMLPLRAPLGMNSSDKLIHERLSGIPFYKKELSELMPPLVGSFDEFNIMYLLAPLEFYVSSLISPPAPFDEWIAGKDDALSEQQKRGFQLFTGKGNCANCHSGWRFSDGKVYDIGLDSKAEMNVPGFVPLAEAKAVGLRNISRRPPYFHDGSMSTLEEVIDFYNRGGDVQRPKRSEHIEKLNLTEQEKLELRLFLDSLSSQPVAEIIPVLPR